MGKNFSYLSSELETNLIVFSIYLRIMKMGEKSTE